MKNNSSAIQAATAGSDEKEKNVRDEDYDESDDEDEPIANKDYADISAHPIDVLSHFTIISDNSVKTPKYRCKCCKYEFTASSTTRLKQHIMGYDVYSNDTPKKVVKDIKECIHPYAPLKDALIAEFNNNKLHKRPRASAEDRLSSGGDEDFAATPKSAPRKKARISEAPKLTSSISWNEASVSAREFSNVATKESFDEQCPEFDVTETPFAVPNTFKSESAILEWLETVVGDWVASAIPLAYREGSSLRFPVYEVLKSVAALTENTKVFSHNPTFDSAETAHAIDRFAARNLNQSSMTAETSIPVNIDTTNVQQMKDVYAAIGKYVNGRGRVDFSIIDRPTNKIRCIVEVNESLGTGPVNKLNGFWEILHDLVHTFYLNATKTPLLAVLTDYKQWVFFKLDGNVIQHTPVYTLFNADVIAPEVTEQSYAISKFLFEVFQVSPIVNLKQKSESSSVFKKNYSEAALITLRDNLRIAQEIKKKDDEILRLKEELAKIKGEKAKK